jgi:hypothetical protein
MSAQAFAIFNSPIGTCGIAWNAKGIAGFQLPSATADATRSRLQQRWTEAVESVPPPGVQRSGSPDVAPMSGGATPTSMSGGAYMPTSPYPRSGSPELGREPGPSGRA